MEWLVRIIVGVLGGAIIFAMTVGILRTWLDATDIDLKMSSLALTVLLVFMWIGYIVLIIHAPELFL
jgi:hypothetical protein